MQLAVNSHTNMVFSPLTPECHKLNPMNLVTAAGHLSVSHRQQFQSDLCLARHSCQMSL